MQIPGSLINKLNDPVTVNGFMKVYQRKNTVSYRKAKFRGLNITLHHALSQAISRFNQVVSGLQSSVRKPLQIPPVILLTGQMPFLTGHTLQCINAIGLLVVSGLELSCRVTNYLPSITLTLTTCLTLTQTAAR